MAGQNPAFAKTLEQIKNLPETNPSQVVSEQPTTLNDVVVKTGVLFGFVIVSAAVGWFILPQNFLILIGLMLTGLVLGIVNSVKQVASPPLIFLYGIVQGLFLGALSSFFASQYGNVVQQAVLGTFVGFLVTLFVYKTKIVKVTSKTRKIFFISLIAYLGIAVVSFIAALFGVGGGWGFYGVGIFGILLCMVGVTLAAFSLIMDYDNIEQVVRLSQQGMPVPKNVDWKLAFGLTVTLIWLYIELLRLFSIINSSN